MDKYIHKTRIPARPRQPTTKPNYQQIKISDMKKVTKLDDVIDYKQQYSAALNNYDLSRCIDILHIFNNIHVGTDVLTSTGIGVVIGKCRKLNYLLSFKSAITSSMRDNLVDDVVLVDNDSTEDSGTGTSTNSSGDELNEIVKLSKKLIDKWKHVYKSETDRLQQQAKSIDFTSYSTNSFRVKSLKSLYKQCDTTYTDISINTHPSDAPSKYIAGTIESYIFKQCLRHTNSSSNQSKKSNDQPINTLSDITNSLYTQMIRGTVQALVSSPKSIQQWKDVYNQIMNSAASADEQQNILKTQVGSNIHEWLKNLSNVNILFNK